MAKMCLLTVLAAVPFYAAWTAADVYLVRYARHKARFL
jgi:hypothetical protein